MCARQARSSATQASTALPCKGSYRQARIYPGLPRDAGARPRCKRETACWEDRSASKGEQTVPVGHNREADDVSNAVEEHWNVLTHLELQETPSGRETEDTRQCSVDQIH